MIDLPRLYAIADASFGDPVDICQALIQGGARLIQIRNKPASSRQLLQQVEDVLRLAPNNVRILVNDRADVALMSGAHGAHVGQDDLPADKIRQILGAQAVVGLSTHNVEQAQRADGLPVDYIAAGPVFATASKANPDPVLGLDGLRQICRTVRKPVVAIGGITLETANEVYEAGATSIAVISDLLKTRDICGRTRQWVGRYT